MSDTHAFTLWPFLFVGIARNCECDQMVLALAMLVDAFIKTDSLGLPISIDLAHTLRVCAAPRNRISVILCISILFLHFLYFSVTLPCCCLWEAFGKSTMQHTTTPYYSFPCHKVRKRGQTAHMAVHEYLKRAAGALSLC